MSNNDTISKNTERYAEWLQIYLKHIREISVEAHVHEEEGYKFESVQQFYNTFDIDAPDLAGNLDAAIINNNLVTGAMYFPRKMLLLYAQAYPEDTREILRCLFDESVDVAKRITEAQQDFNDLELRRSKALQHKPAATFIGLRFLSLLLGFRYPETHNALKPVEWKVFARFIDPEFSMPNHTPPGEQYNIYNRYIEPLRAYLKQRPEIIEIRDQLIAGLGFQDYELHWMTQDVIFVTARVFAHSRSNETESVLPAREPVDDVADEATAYDTDESTMNTGFMPLEKYLEEYVVKNWDNIKFGEKLHMYLDEDGTTGQQYTTDVGIIDILAVDDNNDFVVIELKRAESGYKVVGQILNYMGWVQDKLAQDGQKVRGMIIVGQADKTLRAAVRPVANMIALKEYRIKMILEDGYGHVTH